MADTAPIPLLNVQIDGEWHQFPKGTRVIEACKQAGKFIPHYCYHPKLSSPGNCRMCLIEMGMPKMTPDRKPELGPDGKPVINWIPRPQISCAQDVAEGMAVRTSSPQVEEWRKGVMEFLLINHPLDCPICDQAGECRLQEFSVEFGQGKSRFLEEKVKKPKNTQIGPRVTLDDERCILCSRCIRFMREVAHDDVLGFTERGSYNTLTCHPGRKLDSNYSLNTVDICPVGALTSTDFRFKMRVWFLKETKSFCTSCATGCNTLIGSREQKVYRQTPRQNDAVNECWMCDYGRLNFHYLESPDRFQAPQVNGPDGIQNAPWKQAIQTAASVLKSVAPHEAAILASARQTNEELWLTRKLQAQLGNPVTEIVPRFHEPDDILLSADANPNTNGARLLGITSEPGSKLSKIKEGIRSGAIKVLLSIHEDPSDLGLEEAEIAKLAGYVAIGLLPNPASKHASVILPGSGFAEKRGSMINGKGRIQRLNKAVNAPGQARDDWEILRDLAAACGATATEVFIEDVFSDMAASVPALAGLSLTRIGDLGTSLSLDFLPAAQPEKAGV
jgi:NADH-quinone oxidoreductase subunit G